MMRSNRSTTENVTVRVKVGDHWYTVEVEDLTVEPVRAIVDGDIVEVRVGEAVAIQPDALIEDVADSESDVSSGGASGPAPSTGRVFRTPMPGVIISVDVSVGDQVVTGDDVCVLEAMKMQQTLRADWSGIVKTVYVQPGQQVLDGAPIIDLA